MKDRISQLIEAKRDYYTRLNDKIWETPELGYRESASAKALEDALRENGFTVESPVAGIPTAFKAVYGTGKPVVGFLAEYDALSGLSQAKGCPTPSPIEAGAPGHGCGHNALGTVCVAAAVAMKEYMAETGTPGTVIVFGCPAEEQGCGKAFMARAGVFDVLDVALAPHPMDNNSFFTASLANIQASFSFKGVAAHAAAAPHRGRSALDAADLMIVGVQFLREHIVQEARIHHAYLDVGGTAPNVVQASSKLLFYIRAPKADQVRDIFARMQKVAQGAALMTETSVDVAIESAMVDFVPNDVVTNIVADAWAQYGSCPYSKEAYDIAARMAPSVDNNTDHVIDDSVPVYDPKAPGSPGSTDVGDVSYTVPTAMVTYSGVCVGTPNHSWQFVAQSATPIMHDGNIHCAKVLALAGMNLLGNPDAIAAAKEELKAKTGCRYDCLIPDEVQPDLGE